ncbi:putative leader peptide [Modestobacter caceresii]
MRTGTRVGWVWHDRAVTDCGALLVERLHVDLARVSSAACRAAR